MPRTVNLHTLQDLSKSGNVPEILLETKINTELHIIAQTDRTIIKLPYGNKFDIIDGLIIIHEK